MIRRSKYVIVGLVILTVIGSSVILVYFLEPPRLPFYPTYEQTMGIATSKKLVGMSVRRAERILDVKFHAIGGTSNHMQAVVPYGVGMIFVNIAVENGVITDCAAVDE